MFGTWGEGTRWSRALRTSQGPQLSVCAYTHSHTHTVWKIPIEPHPHRPKSRSYPDPGKSGPLDNSPLHTNSTCPLQSSRAAGEVGTASAQRAAGSRIGASGRKEALAGRSTITTQGPSWRGPRSLLPVLRKPFLVLGCPLHLAWVKLRDQQSDFVATPALTHPTPRDNSC